MPAKETKTRAPERTREAVLDAAEALFSERGYEGTSLQEVATAAGVSRATPSYFFGSKEQLYRAVLERMFVPPLRLIERVGELAARGAPAEEMVRVAIAEYVDFLFSRPAFVRLVGWEALRGGALLNEIAAHVDSVRAGRDLLAAQLELGAFRPVDPAQLLISVVGMCFFPIAHYPFVEALGLDPRDPAFLEERKRHVVDLVLHGVSG